MHDIKVVDLFYTLTDGLKSETCYITAYHAKRSTMLPEFIFVIKNFSKEIEV